MATITAHIEGLQDKNTIFFDGVCNLCNNFINFVIKHNEKRDLYFASLQSPAGEKAIAYVAGLKMDADTVLFYDGLTISTRSDAVFKITKHLSGGWFLLSAFAIFPRFVRDAVYKWVARNRYRWFGKRDKCMVPSKELLDRFIM